MKLNLALITLLFLTFSIDSTNAQTWSQKQGFSEDPRFGATGFSADGKGYVFSGDNGTQLLTELLEYNPTFNTWTSKSTFLFNPRIGAFVFSNGIDVFIGGGWSGSIAYSDMHQYFPASDSWSTRATFPGKGARYSMFATIGNTGFLAGGASGNTVASYSDEFWTYDMQNNQWTQLANIPLGIRIGGLAFAIADTVYFGFGHNGSSDFQDLWAYDVNNNIWTQKADLPGFPRLQANVFVTNGKATVGGGFRLGAQVELQDYYEFDPKKNAWAQVSGPTTNASRSLASTFVIDNKGYISAGRTNSASTRLSDLWEFTPLPNGLDESNTESISIYPNPVHNKFSIDLGSQNTDNLELFIYDSKGRPLLHKINIHENSEINIEELENGLFFCKIQSGDKVYIKKLVKASGEF